MSAGLALQAALLARLGGEPALAALVGGRIFDRVPPGAAFPHVALGPAAIYDCSTGTERGWEHLFTINVWQRALGRRSTYEIMAAIEAALAPARLDLGRYRLVTLDLQQLQARAEDGRDGYGGTMRYRAVTEDGA
ncbi:DUF3168 domain-containing protein [Phyllobacterium sp. 21LDTY02-6]|jgi:hypothetical protein|uniref:DUF3168 domain-containing protein n=1 Tax=Phyllobacterium sp. 21LDTY02-6 TaxID=2944903 RepID=UPI00202294DB|nr:DUF3168 domain-containing protein [Phyllobacterium sp. 21LDTY02-6]MCO4318345.1 DUF3168 domain-containing protein [Phyllobacterium sp. 21LDTY02-6]